MVDLDSQRLDIVFQSLGNSTRRRLLQMLKDGPATVGALAEPFEMSLAGVSKHLLILESAGLVSREIKGRETWCALEAERLAEARTFLDQYRAFWDRQLESLASHLDQSE